MSQKQQIKLIGLKVEKSLPVEPRKPAAITNKVQIDDAYKEFFASLFKIKDSDVQRRVLQAVNGQNVTCANCATKIMQSKAVPPQKNPQTKTSFSTSTQTMTEHFEFLKKINSSTKPNAAMKTTATTINTAKNNNNNNSSECFILNKIQLGRARRKFEPYAVKKRNEKLVIPSKVSYLQGNYGPDSILNKIRKPAVKTESPPVQAIQKNYSITEKLLLENLDSDQSMTPHAFFNFKSDEAPAKLNDFVILSTLEQEMRTADVRNEEGLYTIHMATINGDLFKLRRLMVIYNYNKSTQQYVNIRSEDGKKETPLHFAMSCTNNPHNNAIIHILCDHGANAMAVNDAGDTVLHLAAEAIDDFGIITKLFSKISLADLSKQNDKSQTILHVAAANKNRTFVRSILNFIDAKLNISSVGNDIPFTDANEYFQKLDDLHLTYVKSFISVNFKKPPLHPIKAKILNERDGRSGKTAVFLSIEINESIKVKDQSTCLMLLAHFADTRIEDFANNTCAYYSTEILKNRIIAQAIYYADSMHSAVVVKPLKQTETRRSMESRKRSLLHNDNDFDDGSDIMSKVAKALG